MERSYRDMNEKKIKAYIAYNPTKYDTRYKANWFDGEHFKIDHKHALFLEKKSAISYIENRSDWIISVCYIVFKEKSLVTNPL